MKGKIKGERGVKGKEEKFLNRYAAIGKILRRMPVAIMLIMVVMLAFSFIPAVNADTAPFDVTTKGHHVVEYFSVDKSGNEGSVRSSEFKINVNESEYLNSITWPIDISKIRFVHNAVNEQWVKSSKWPEHAKMLMYWQKDTRYLINLELNETGHVQHVEFSRYGNETITDIPFKLAAQSIRIIIPYPPPSTFFVTGDEGGYVYIYVYNPTNANFDPRRNMKDLFSGGDINIAGPCAAPAVADFDGDGDLDVIMANKNTEEFYLFENMGAGFFLQNPMGNPGITGEIGRDAGMAADFIPGGLIDYAVVEWDTFSNIVKLWMYDYSCGSWLEETLPISPTGYDDPEGMDTTLLFRADPFPDIFLIAKTPPGQIVYLLKQTSWGTWTAVPNIITPDVNIPQKSFHGLAASGDGFRPEFFLLGVTDVIIGHDGGRGGDQDPGAAWLYYGTEPAFSFCLGSGNNLDIYDLNNTGDTGRGLGWGFVDAWDFDGDHKDELVATAYGIGVFVIDDVNTGFIPNNIDDSNTAKNMLPIAAPSGPGVSGF
jgi:hypothetical protein